MLYIQVMLLFQPARQLAYIFLSDHMAHLNETYHFMDPQVLVCVDLFPYGSSGLCLCRPIPLMGLQVFACVDLFFYGSSGLCLCKVRSLRVQPSLGHLLKANFCDFYN